VDHLLDHDNSEKIIIIIINIDIYIYICGFWVYARVAGPPLGAPLEILICGEDAIRHPPKTIMKIFENPSCTYL
jgi:hypothetical protein